MRQHYWLFGKKGWVININPEKVGHWKVAYQERRFYFSPDAVAIVEYGAESMKKAGLGEVRVMVVPSNMKGDSFCPAGSVRLILVGQNPEEVELLGTIVSAGVSVANEARECGFLNDLKVYSSSCFVSFIKWGITNKISNLIAFSNRVILNC